MQASPCLERLHAQKMYTRGSHSRTPLCTSVSTASVRECAHAQASARPPLCASVPTRKLLPDRRCAQCAIVHIICCALLNLLLRETKKNGFIATFPNHKQKNKTGHHFKPAFCRMSIRIAFFFQRRKTARKMSLVKCGVKFILTSSGASKK